MQNPLWMLFLLAVHTCWMMPLAHAQEAAKTIVIDFSRELGPVAPRTGFLGGLRDATPDAVIQPLHPALWRIGHQFRGRIAKGLPSAIDRVEALGTSYKLVMSDQIGDKPKDFAAYESAVKKLVAQVGARSSRVIWEPVNEPDISHKPITGSTRSMPTLSGRYARPPACSDLRPGLCVSQLYQIPRISGLLPKQPSGVQCSGLALYRMGPGGAGKTTMATGTTAGVPDRIPGTKDR